MRGERNVTDFSWVQAGVSRLLPAGARGRFTRWLLAGLVALGFGALGFTLAPASEPPQERAFTIEAAQYAYDPAVIRVNRGDTLRLRFVSRDVIHGFYLEGHDLDVKITPMQSHVQLRRPSQPGQVEQTEEVIVTDVREGKFRFRCSETCGTVHPFMLGELIVGPNRLLPSSLGLVLGLLVGGLVQTAWPRGQG